jgi:midasin
VHQHLLEASAILRRWSQTHPQLRHLFHPVYRWLTTQDLPPLPPHLEANETQIKDDLLLNSLLLTVQTLISHCPEPKATEAEEEHDDQYILQGYHIVRDFTHLLNIDTIVSVLDDTILLLASRGTGLERHLRRVLPFLDQYLDLVKGQLTTHSLWTKALFKLDFVVCSVLHTLSTQGFCKPPDLDNTGNEEDAMDSVEGVGMGEGSGSQNVSKDIEDESQVEGLQGEEKQEQDTTENKGDNDAIEMSDDFGGDMEDVPDTGSQDGSDEESDVSPEERLGNLDATDPSAIDEKLWGDDNGPEDDRPQEKTNQDHSEKQSGDSEVTAKEESERLKSKEKPSHSKEAGDERISDVEDEPMPGDIDDDAPNDPEASGAPMEDYLQDANTLDLPDDLDLGNDDKDLGDDLPEDMTADDEGPIDDAVDDGRMESNTDDAVADQQMEAPPPDNTPEHDQDADMPSQPQEVDSDPEAEATGEDAIARPDVSAGNGVASLPDPSISDGRKSESGGQTGLSEGVAGENIASDTKEQDE